MWNVLMHFARGYAPYITLPIAALVGYVGLTVEKRFRKDTPWREKSTQEERDERRLNELATHDATEVDHLEDKKDLPRTILDRNTSKR